MGESGGGERDFLFGAHLSFLASLTVLGTTCVELMRFAIFRRAHHPRKTRWMRREDRFAPIGESHSSGWKVVFSQDALDRDGIDIAERWSHLPPNRANGEAAPPSDLKVSIHHPRRTEDRLLIRLHVHFHAPRWKVVDSEPFSLRTNPAVVSLVRLPLDVGGFAHVGGNPHE